MVDGGYVFWVVDVLLECCVEFLEVVFELQQELFMQWCDDVLEWFVCVVFEEQFEIYLLKEYFDEQFGFFRVFEVLFCVGFFDYCFVDFQCVGVEVEVVFRVLGFLV